MKERPHPQKSTPPTYGVCALFAIDGGFAFFLPEFQYTFSLEVMVHIDFRSLGTENPWTEGGPTGISSRWLGGAGQSRYG